MTIENIDRHIDVDAILYSYDQKAKKTSALVAAVALIVSGCIGTVVMIQDTHQKAEQTTAIAKEMAALTQKSGYCEENPAEPGCEKLAEVLTTPSSDPGQPVFPRLGPQVVLKFAAPTYFFSSTIKP